MENENKVVILDGRMLISYTGIADLDGKHMHVWLADWLVKHAKLNVSGMIDDLSNALRLSLSRLRVQSRHKLLAVSACAWIRDPKSGTSRATMMEVANFDNASLRLLSQDALTFRRTKEMLRPEWAYALDSIGQRIPKDLISSLNRRIRAAYRKRAGVGAIIELMIECMRATSHRNASVGKDLMIVHMPRAAIESGQTGIGLAVGPELLPNCVSSLYLKHGAKEFYQLSPAYVRSPLSGPGSYVIRGTAISGQGFSALDVLDRTPFKP